MQYSVEEIKQYAAEEDVKFIRMAFCDAAGRQKNIAIMPEELDRAFQYVYIQLTRSEQILRRLPCPLVYTCKRRRAPKPWRTPRRLPAAGSPPRFPR